MSEMVFCEKPDNVSWDAIHELIYKAHKSNRDNGINIRNANLSGDDLKNSLGKEGKCFVAIDNDIVVATCSVSFQELNTKFYKGKAAYLTLAAVSPEYKGRRLYTQINSLRQKYIQEAGYCVQFMKIAQGNYIRCKIAKKEGFQKYAITHNNYNDHYYFSFVKFSSPLRSPKVQILFCYTISWLKVMIRRIIK